MRYKLITLVLLMAAAASSFAADIQPGLWELALETRVPASPDFAPPPNTMNQCLTEQDAKDPSRVLGGVANPGASDCTYTEKSFSGSTFRFKMQCAGTLGMHVRGEITYSATTMAGNLISTANMMGQVTELHSKVTARWLGECKAEAK